MGTMNRTFGQQPNGQRAGTTVTLIARRRIATGLLGAFLGGVALLGGSTAAADDLHAGEIQQSGQIDTSSVAFDHAGDANGDRAVETTMVPLLPVTGSVPPTVATPQAGTGYDEP